MIDIRFRCFVRSAKIMVDFDEMKKHGDFYKLLEMPDQYPVIQSTGLTSPCGREIWFGDFYYNAGYGNLHINTMSDVYILLDGLSENDIGEYLGNEYQNPELLKDES
jgi:hypothetical protein